MTAVGHWVLNTNSGALKLVGSQNVGKIDVALSAVQIRELFPPSLLFPPTQLAAKEGEKEKESNEPLYRIYSQELETDLWKAIEKFTEDIPHQCRIMTFHETKFDLCEKTRRSEHQRTTYRVDTRLYQVQPELKTVVNFLCPTLGAANIQLQKTIQFSVVQDNTHLKTLNQAYDVYHKTPYPFCFRGSLPVSIMKSDIPSIYDNQQFWSVAPKTNGLRFFLLACTFYNQRLAVFMDRSLKLYLVPLALPQVWFQGTILDGELVSLQTGGHAFIIFDCWQMNGVPVAQESYLNRLQIASLALDEYQKTKTSRVDIELRVKAVYTIQDAPAMLMNELPAMDHLLDGLIFTAVEPSAPIGRASHKIYKYKVGMENTIDCMIVYPSPEREPYRLDLLCTGPLNQNQKGFIHWATIQDVRTAQDCELLTCCATLGLGKCSSWEQVCETIDGKVVECAYLQNKQMWKLKTIREKADANLLSTAEKTLQNVYESLRLTDVFPEYSSWTKEQRKTIDAWEEGFQKTLNANWTIAPQLKLGKQKDYIPIRVLAPVPLQTMTKLLVA